MNKWKSNEIHNILRDKHNNNSVYVFWHEENVSEINRNFVPRSTVGMYSDVQTSVFGRIPLKTIFRVRQYCSSNASSLNE